METKGSGMSGDPFYKIFRAIHIAKLSHLESKLMFYLLDRANQENRIAFPSLKTIEMDTGIPRTSAARAMARLERDGWIKSERRFNNSTHRTVCLPQSAQTEYPSDVARRASSATLIGSNLALTPQSLGANPPVAPCYPNVLSNDLKNDLVGASPPKKKRGRKPKAQTQVDAPTLIDVALPPVVSEPPPKKGRPPNAPPTLEMVMEYGKGKMPRSERTKFFDYYAKRRWKMNHGQYMGNIWEAKADDWIRRWREQSPDQAAEYDNRMTPERYDQIMEEARRDGILSS